MNAKRFKIRTVTLLDVEAVIGYVSSAPSSYISGIPAPSRNAAGVQEACKKSARGVQEVCKRRARVIQEACKRESEVNMRLARSGKDPVCNDGPSCRDDMLPTTQGPKQASRESTGPNPQQKTRITIHL